MGSACSWGTCKKLIPPLILIVYTFLGAMVFFFVEKDKGGGIVTYWDSVFYAQTLYSTIGYGNVRAKTNLGKGLTVGYILLGIPLALIALESLGQLLALAFTALWRLLKASAKRLRRCCCGGKRKVDAKKMSIHHIIVGMDEEGEEEQKVRLPFLVGVCLTVGWLAMLGVLFTMTEGWDYFRSCYFVFVSITTVGLGEELPQRRHIGGSHIAVLMLIGLALFSMLVSLLRDALEALSKTISGAIRAQYLAKLERENPDSPPGRDGEAEDKDRPAAPPEQPQDTGKGASKSAVRGMMTAQPGGRFLGLLMGESQEEHLAEEWQSRARMRSRAVQAGPSRAEAGTLTELLCQDHLSDAVLRDTRLLFTSAAATQTFPQESEGKTSTTSHPTDWLGQRSPPRSPRKASKKSFRSPFKFSSA